MKLISFDIESNFGFFRKPESNNTLNVSYNMIHRPAILGILGAIIGLEGYKEKGKFPEYYKRLNHLKIGITPLNHEQRSEERRVGKECRSRRAPCHWKRKKNNREMVEERIQQKRRV